MPRLFYRYPDLDKVVIPIHQTAELTIYDPNQPGREPCPEPEANLISSLCENGLHLPVFDVDQMPAWRAVAYLYRAWSNYELEGWLDPANIKVIPSSTPGHTHIYVEQWLTWENYQLLLGSLAGDGVIELGYYHASIARHQTFVRKPGVHKPQLRITTGTATAKGEF